jgi:hypothetical protein
LVDEFHLPAVFKSLDPLFVQHISTSSCEISVRREYTLFGAINCGPRIRERLAMSLDLLTNAMVLIGSFLASIAVTDSSEIRECTGMNRYPSSALVPWLRRNDVEELAIRALRKR